MPEEIDLARRGLFRGRLRVTEPPVQLPWSVAWPQFSTGCTRCGDCLAACPEQILVNGEGGFPSVDFQRGECTFCGDCVAACKEPLFRPASETPWQYKASIAANCLANGQVYCQRCQDSCEPRAIRFIPTLGRVPTPVIELDSCNGCGACVQDCPVGSIKVDGSAASAQKSQNESGIE
ncbi:ferredoxin-type protein NapF [Aeromonas jandaei]|uniref:Ferredoxin-type protein NapF n=1 Tax=Aeromonas jandaei TaxID=650 RepID=A0A7T4A8P4_AERJA|nr:ferredoxin-type protein NapF [Aeromonas jandaei]QQB19375.1 ferredoxin-type protein NapF [Aeromonas jandaei]UCA34049.1 ferredoxin-type protein NapF [Aeromonas jandaei]